MSAGTVGVRKLEKNVVSLRVTMEWYLFYEMLYSDIKHGQNISSLRKKKSDIPKDLMDACTNLTRIQIWICQDLPRIFHGSGPPGEGTGS